VNTTKSLNILAASDIHGAISVYEWIADRAGKNDIDILLLAGDLMAYGGRQCLDDIQRILLDAGKPVLFVMGNMDRAEWISEAPFFNIHGKRHLFNDVPFVGYHYSNPFAGGIFEKDEEGQALDMEVLSGLVDENTVFVTHGPCYGILDEPRPGLHAGSRSLRRFCDERRPKYHLFGHIHESPGVVNNHFNVAYPLEKTVLKLEYYSGKYEIIRAG